MHEQNAFSGAEPIWVLIVLCIKNQVLFPRLSMPDHSTERASWSPTLQISKVAKLMCFPPSALHYPKLPSEKCACGQPTSVCSFFCSFQSILIASTFISLH